MHEKLNSFGLEISYALLKVFLIMFVCLKNGGRDCVILDISIGKQKWLSKAEERRADRKEEVFESNLEPLQSM